MWIYLNNIISCLLVLTIFTQDSIAKKPKLSDLSTIDSQEHVGFLESPSSYKGYRQNSNSYNNEEGGSAPEPYMFNYDIQDNDNNKQFRKEESNGNAVKGSYGYVDANGLYRTVEYTADSEYGFRAKVKTNEPGISDYYTDNSKTETVFPADVILEVAESPRNLHYSSSDQSNNYGFEKKSNYQKNTKSRNYQQYNDFDQYAASNNNHNYDTQQPSRKSGHDTLTGKEQLKYSTTGNNAYTNWNTYGDKGKGFEYQSSFSDGHPVYVDFKSSRAINPVSSRSVIRNLIKNNDNIENESDSDESTDNKITVVNNLKFTNRTVVDRKDTTEPKHKKVSINLKTEKPLQQYKFVQKFRPFHEIREKFIREHPRRFTGSFVNTIR